MKITRFKITDKTRQVTSPCLTLILNGKGCWLKGCNCSQHNFISISDGKIGLTVELTIEETKEILKKKSIRMLL